MQMDVRADETRPRAPCSPEQTVIVDVTIIETDSFDSCHGHTTGLSEDDCL
ncbi:uncharacterized protein FFMR_11277 [Fusarium fujikuroi]|nr:uncharacterized protein FFMR_11277 [Fusarium fujikuroi]